MNRCLRQVEQACGLRVGTKNGQRSVGGVRLHCGKEAEVSADPFFRPVSMIDDSVSRLVHVPVLELFFQHELFVVSHENMHLAGGMDDELAKDFRRQFAVVCPVKDVTDLNKTGGVSTGPSCTNGAMPVPIDDGIEVRSPPKSCVRKPVSFVGELATKSILQGLRVQVALVTHADSID